MGLMGPTEKRQWAERAEAVTDDAPPFGPATGWSTPDQAPLSLVDE